MDTDESIYKAAVISELAGIVTVQIGFGEPATNADLVPAATASIARLDLHGGRGIRFNGPASVPVASAITHAVCHKYGFVAWFDPKLQGYVVAVSHDPSVRAGDMMLSETTGAGDTH